MNIVYIASMVAKIILPYLSMTAVASAFGLYLCGISICKRIHRLGSSDTTSGALFLVGFLSCAFWLQYGLVMEDCVIVFCNGVGFLLQTSYLVYYYSMLKNRVIQNFVRRAIAFELAVIVSMVFCLNYFHCTGLAVDILITFCMLLNVATIGAPLASIGEVLRTKSTESMPLLVCIASFLVSVQWLLYGIIVDDFVIQAPNYITTAISTSQLALFLVYPRTSSTRKQRPLPFNRSDTV